MENRGKQDKMYAIFVPVAQGFLKLLLYICIILLVILAGKSAYSFGYQVFNQKPMAASEEEATAITITVEEEDSVYQIGAYLQEKGLVINPEIFWIRELLSDYHGDIQPGTYRLNSYQTIDEMLAILTKENTEGQPESEETVEDAKT
ncbi:MAG: hypothetical protein U0L12_03830 [Ruminococcus sp.]|nr:hypothetical protein [Ruminococcus sp.]